jgi:predicted RNase H-like HicB family nuclease
MIIYKTLSLGSSQPGCTSLPGCISQGRTKEEALNNTKEAIQAYIDALKEDGIAVPEERFDALLAVA